MKTKLHKTRQTEILVSHIKLDNISTTSIILTLVGTTLNKGVEENCIIPINISKVYVDEDTVDHLIRTYSKLYETVVEDGIPTPFILSPAVAKHEDDGFNLDVMSDLHPIKWEFNEALVKYHTY